MLGNDSNTLLPTTSNHTAPSKKRPSTFLPAKTSYASFIPAFFASRLNALVVALVFAVFILLQLTALSHQPSFPTPGDESSTSPAAVVASHAPSPANEVANTATGSPATTVKGSSDLPEGVDVAFRDFYNLMEANGFVNSRKYPVMVQVNQGFVHLAENLACTAVNASMYKGLMVYWSMDPTTHEYLTARGYLSYYNPERFTTHHGAESYHSENYNKMMRDRITFWQTLTNMGVSFFWVDADIAIHKDIRYLIERPAYADLDGAFQVDTGHLPIFQEYMLGKYLPRPDTAYIEACGGFFFLRSTPRTKTFLGRVKEVMDNDATIEDQQALNVVLKNRQKSMYLPPFEGWDPRADVHPEHKLVWTYLSHQEVPGGRLLPHTRPELRYVSHLNSLGDTKTKIKYLIEKGWWNCPHLKNVLKMEQYADKETKA
ncbi:hypothetical protein HDU96_001765 [Phlyctochytrium bullatum]|nr:hypothetical protein HDU96_001765 [Phlyctochytrium bullatum]